MLIPLILGGQILNIEQQRIRTDTTGWSGDARFAFDWIDNRNWMVQTSARVHIQRQWKHDLVLWVGDYGMIRTSGSDVSNSGFGHLRVNRKFARITAEAFVQAQFNKILNVRFRFLAGAGPRFKLIQGNRFRLYAAFLGMAEHEVEESTGLIRNDWRMSDYISWTWNWTDALTLVQTTYFQPLFFDFADYRVMSQTDAVFRVAKRFSVSFSFQYAADTRPSEGAVQSTRAVRHVLSYNFGR